MTALLKASYNMVLFYSMKHSITKIADILSCISWTVSDWVKISLNITSDKSKQHRPTMYNLTLSTMYNLTLTTGRLSLQLIYIKHIQ